MAETWGQSKVRSRGRAELKPWDSAGRGGLWVQVTGYQTASWGWVALSTPAETAVLEPFMRCRSLPGSSLPQQREIRSSIPQ